MSKKLIVDKENPNGVLVDMTAEEIADNETKTQASIERKAQAETDKQAKENLKASAKAKLIAGDPLTAEEADTIVL